MRFSAMGDVVLLVPVILSVLQQYPDTKISLLTRPFFHPFFQGIPNIELPKVDLKGKHKGVNGLHTLVKELSVKNTYDAILDMHSVIRSRIIDFFFWTKNIPVYRIDKGRSEKKHF
ncbi:MAG TPA: ADP-heptose--LPS heptosyltransferase RfaF, partial [Saprospiraceae bacterium]|nr:ADP-heptose--LPS heptosyltransferase RfaF [Saprospiraceae bacterium]